MTLSKDELLAKLQNGVVTVTFEKTTGETRVMRATLDPNVLPPAKHAPEPTVKKTERDAINVWDIEETAWRSFKFSKLVSAE